MAEPGGARVPADPEHLAELEETPLAQVEELVRRTATPTLDLEMLAYDVADMLDRNEHPIDATQDEVREALPAFLAHLAEIVARRLPEADHA